MTKTEDFVQSVLGGRRKGNMPFVLAIDLTAQLLFKEGFSTKDILVTKDVYPVVAKRLHMKHTAASRQILRVANRCWGKLSDEQKEAYIGRAHPFTEGPRELLICLAVYLYSGKPLFGTERGE